jgi:hypothetical protein
MFAETPVVTIRGSVDALRLKLWDEERGCLVRFPARAQRLRRRMATGRERRAEVRLNES